MCHGITASLPQALRIPSGVSQSPRRLPQKRPLQFIGMHRSLGKLMSRRTDYPITTWGCLFSFLSMAADFTVQISICYFSADVIRCCSQRNVQEEGFAWLIMAPEGQHGREAHQQAADIVWNTAESSHLDPRAGDREHTGNRMTL